MKVKREIASLPVRSGRETWQTIIELITSPDSIDADQLNAAAGVMASAITDEHCATVPIVIKGVGSRLVIYTRHGADAMEIGLAVDALTWNPTGGNAWQITVPCDRDDVGWMNDALKSRAPRITVHDAATPPSEGDGGERRAAEVEIDWEARQKP